MLLIRVRDVVDIEVSKNELSELWNAIAIDKNKSSDKQDIDPHDHRKSPLEKRNMLYPYP